MQHSQPFAGFHQGSRFQLHMTTAGKKTVIGLTNRLMSSHGFPSHYEDCGRLI